MSGTHSSSLTLLQAMQRREGRAQHRQPDIPPVQVLPKSWEMPLLDHRARRVERQREWQSLKLSQPILTPGKGSSCCQGLGSYWEVISGSYPLSFLSGSKSLVGFRKSQECWGLFGGAETSLRGDDVLKPVWDVPVLSERE